MEILFKDDVNVFCVFEDSLTFRDLDHFDTDMSNNIKHLDDAKILYHYKDIESGMLFPVYFEYRNKIISTINDEIHHIVMIEKHFIKDYTIKNLSLFGK